VRPLLPDDLAMQPGAELAVRRKTEALGLNDGVLVAADGRAAVIYAEVRPDADRYAIRRQVQQLKEQEEDQENKILLSGTSLAQAALGESSASDLMRLIPLVLFVLAIGLAVAFRHPVPALISLTEIGASLLWTTGLMGLTGQSVFVTTLVLPVVLLSVGVSDDVYALKSYFHERRLARTGTHLEAIVKVFQALRRPIALTTTTTVVGLLSMAVTPLEPLRVFGIFSALSILFSTLCTFTLVPALLVLLNPVARSERQTRQRRSNRRMLTFFNQLVSFGPSRVVMMMAVLALCAALMARSVRVDDNWMRNLPQASEIVQGDQELNELLAGTTTLELMIDSGQPNGFLDPHYIMTLSAIEEAVTALPYVGACYSVSNDIERINATLSGMSYPDFRRSVREQMKAMEEQMKAMLEQMKAGRRPSPSPSLAAAFSKRLESGDIERALVMLTVSRRASFSQWIDKDYRRARMSIFIRSADYQRIRQVLETVRSVAWKHLPNEDAVTPFGDGWISYTTVRLLVEGQVRSIVFALVMDFLLLTMLLGSIRMSLTAILPIVFSVLFVFAVLAAIGLPLGIANSMFTGIAIGIGCDFAVHLTAAYRHGVHQGRRRLNAMRQAFVRTGPAIFTSAATIASGFLILTLSSIRPNMELGLMICLCLTTCALATLIIVPGLALARRSPAT
jgi:predicted RND superfamily exporter protein